MSIDEAISFLELYKTSIDFNDTVRNLAIEALEKQMVKAPTRIARFDDAFKFGCTHRCERCNAGLIAWDKSPSNYCGNCGQRLVECEVDE